MDVLAIDPGKWTGGAFACDGRILAFSMREPTATAVYRTLRWASFCSSRRVHLVTEDQFVARGTKANPRATLSVARSAERWLTCADLLGFRTSQVVTSVWREPVIREIGAEHGDKKERTRVKIARLWPQILFFDGSPAEVKGEMVETIKLDDDPVDALGMLRWAMMSP